MKVIIFAGAKIQNYDFCKEYIQGADLIICCDGGMEHAKNLQVKPDYIVGDFDSVKEDVFAYFKAMNIPTYTFPTQKDETDMQLGIEVAIKEGGTDLILFGGIGDRFDHTLANAHLLLGLVKKGIRARLVDEKNCVELIDKSMTVYGKAGDLVSTIPLSMVVEGLTLQGFAYPLEKKDLRLDDEVVAVSNVLLDKVGQVEIEKGYLFVICSRD